MPKHKRRFRKAAAVVGAAGVLAAIPATTAAQDVVYSGSLFFNVAFGDGFRFGLGLDLRGTYLFGEHSCRDHSARTGLGAYLQGIMFLQGPFLQVSAGLHGGYQANPDAFGWDFEAGWMWRDANRGMPGGAGLQLGLLASRFPLDAALRFTTFDNGDGWIPEGHVVLGARGPDVFGNWGDLFCSTPGRPQRDGGGLCVGRVYVRHRHFKRREVLVTARREAAGTQWAEDARVEAASVPAFLGLARDLRLAGAPEDLVTRALVAAADEIRHASVCAVMASRKLGRGIVVEVPPVMANRADETDAGRLKRLAVESWRDGCIGEGAAARIAAAEAARAGDRRARRSLEVIAREEKTHAALAWDVVRWASRTGGDAVRAAVADAVAASGTAMAIGGDTVRRGLSDAARARIHAAVVESAAALWRAEG